MHTYISYMQIHTIITIYAAVQNMMVQIDQRFSWPLQFRFSVRFRLGSSPSGGHQRCGGLLDASRIEMSCKTVLIASMEHQFALERSATELRCDQKCVSLIRKKKVEIGCRTGSWCPVWQVWRPCGGLSLDHPELQDLQRGKADPVESWRIPPGFGHRFMRREDTLFHLRGKNRHLADFLGVDVSKYFVCGTYGADMDINLVSKQKWRVYDCKAMVSHGGPEKHIDPGPHILNGEAIATC